MNFFEINKINIIEPMNPHNSTAADLQIYYRLVALWVICEAVLGGMIHGLRLPVSGLIVGSCAVICICLIGKYVPTKGAILKATVIVAIFKMMLSPQAPPPAYIAVFFQGMMGQLLFAGKRHFSLSCMLLAVLALLESALQRIIVLMVLYGKDFWNAVNAFISNLTGRATITNYSFALAVAYILLHAIAGLTLGFFIIQLIKNLDRSPAFHENYFVDNSNSKPLQKATKRKSLRIILFAGWCFLLVLVMQSAFSIGNPIMPINNALRIFVRSALILFTWLLFFNPLLNYFLKKWLKTQQSKSQAHLAQVAKLLPATQELFSKSWEMSSRIKGWRRIKECCKIIVINTLHRHA